MVREVFTVMITDAMVTSHPVSAPIRTPDDIAEYFDTISYNKVLYFFYLKRIIVKGISNVLDESIKLDEYSMILLNLATKEVTICSLLSLFHFASLDFINRRNCHDLYCFMSRFRKQFSSLCALYQYISQIILTEQLFL